MTVKFGIKASAVLSSLALALAFVVGCNSDDATPPAADAGASKAPATDTKAPAGGPMAPKADEKK